MKFEKVQRFSATAVVVIACALAEPTSATAKTLSEDGWKPEFWKSHDVVSGTIVAVDPSESGYSVKCQVASSIVGRFEVGSTVDSTYLPSTSHFGTLPESTIRGLKPGNRVLMLIRTLDGHNSIPNGAGMIYYMMPKSHALYVVEDADDEQFRETLTLCRAISLVDSQARLKAVADLQRNNTSKRMFGILRVYVVHSIRDSEAALRQSQDLLKEWDAQWDKMGGAPVGSGGIGGFGGR